MLFYGLCYKNSVNESDSCSTFHDQTAPGAVQMAALRTRDHCLCSPLVSAVLAFVSGRRGIAHGTRSPCRPHDHLALGAALRTRTEQEMPAGIETDQRLLAGGRNAQFPERGHAGALYCPLFPPRPTFVLC